MLCVSKEHRTRIVFEIRCCKMQDQKILERNDRDLIYCKLHNNDYAAYNYVKCNSSNSIIKFVTIVT
jgi:hypothetical protein